MVKKIIIVFLLFFAVARFVFCADPVLVGSTIDYGGVFYSKNSGKDWVKINGNFGQIAIDYDGKLWGINKYEEILYSQDGGSNWKKTNVKARKILINKDGILWGYNGEWIWRSKDNGTSATNVARMYGLDFSISPDGTLWCLREVSNFPQKKYAMFRSRNDGKSWDQLRNAGDDVETITIAPDGAVWATTRYARILYSVNNGEQWNFVDPDKKYVRSFVVSSDGTLYGMGFPGVYYSKDKGKSWTKVNGNFSYLVVAPNDKFVPAKGWAANDKEKEEAKKIQQELVKSKESLAEEFKKTGAGGTETINTVLERLYKQAILAKDVYAKSNTEFFAYLKSELKQEAIENNLGKTLTQAGEKLKTKVESIKKEAAQLKSESEGLKKEGAALEARSTALQAEGEKLGQKCNPFAQGGEILTNLVGGLNAIKSGDPAALAESGLKAAEAYKDMGVAAAGLAMSLADKTMGNLGDLVGIKLSMPGLGQADIALGAAVKFTDDVTGGLGKLATGDLSGAFDGFKSGLSGIGAGGAALVKSLKIDEGISKATDAIKSVGNLISSGLGSAFGWLSSRRFKENIVDLNVTDDVLDRLHAVAFNFKSDVSKTKQVGLIAEELFEILPELVVLDENKLPVAVRYDLLSVVLLKELQKQHVILRAQEDEIKELARRICVLEV